MAITSRKTLGMSRPKDMDTGVKRDSFQDLEALNLTEPGFSTPNGAVMQKSVWGKSGPGGLSVFNVDGLGTQADRPPMSLTVQEDHLCMDICKWSAQTICRSRGGAGGTPLLLTGGGGVLSPYF